MDLPVKPSDSSDRVDRVFFEVQPAGFVNYELQTVKCLVDLASRVVVVKDGYVTGDRVTKTALEGLPVSTVGWKFAGGFGDFSLRDAFVKLSN